MAQSNFIKSLAAYSIITFLLQIKDRHNGNILLNNKGSISHIDFGFMLLNSPGSVGFELAPFKLTQEYIDIMGGLHSNKFHEFRQLVKTGFAALRKQSESIIGLIEIMEKDSLLPCFTGVVTSDGTVSTKNNSKFLASQSLTDRFQLSMPDDLFFNYVDRLIDSSCNNMFTKLYDSFQYYANGIL
jgi:phosphatidylinositol kinase/protein kinase (PI-3  family)